MIINSITVVVVVERCDTPQRTSGCWGTLCVCVWDANKSFVVNRVIRAKCASCSNNTQSNLFIVLSRLIDVSNSMSVLIYYFTTVYRKCFVFVNLVQHLFQCIFIFYIFIYISVGCLLKLLDVSIVAVTQSRSLHTQSAHKSINQSQ